MNSENNQEDDEDYKVDDGVNQNGEATCAHVPELHQSPFCRYLKQQPRRQQHKQHRCYNHWSPVCHLSSQINAPLSLPLFFSSLLSPTLRSQLWFKIDEEMIRRGVVSMGWGGCEVMWFCNFCLPFVICHHPPQMALSSNSTHPLLCQIIFIPDSCPFPLFSF